MFVNEALFISEQITEYRLGTLLEISDKFNTKLNVFNYMILHCWYNVLESFITKLYDFEKHIDLLVLLERLQFVPQKFICLRERSETFQMGKM